MTDGLSRLNDALRAAAAAPTPPGDAAAAPAAPAQPAADEMQLAVGVEAGRVVLRFDRPVGSFGMDANQAIGLARLLTRAAKRTRTGG